MRASPNTLPTGVLLTGVLLAATLASCALPNDAAPSDPSRVRIQHPDALGVIFRPDESRSGAVRVELNIVYEGSPEQLAHTHEAIEANWQKARSATASHLRGYRLRRLADSGAWDGILPELAEVIEQTMFGDAQPTDATVHAVLLQTLLVQ